MPHRPQLADIKVHVRFKLFALWSSVMFCYIYGDYFELYRPGKLGEMLSGNMALGPVSQGVLLAMAATLAIPALMLCVSVILPARVSRWFNIIVGAVYTAIVILAIRGSWHFYIFLGLIEIALTLLIVWVAWTWPRTPST